MVPLETPRLILRDFVTEDWRAIHAYQTNPLYLRYYPWTERTPEAVQAFVQQQIRNQEAQPRLQFQMVITLRDTGQLIGNCGVRMQTAGAFEGDMGYELNPALWGQGIATEAARAIAAFGFESLGLHRIWAHCIAENVASARVLEKVGLRQEGRLRDKEQFKGRYWDVLLYGMLEDEWRASSDSRALNPDGRSA